MSAQSVSKASLILNYLKMHRFNIIQIILTLSYADELTLKRRSSFDLHLKFSFTYYISKNVNGTTAGIYCCFNP